MTRKNGNPTSSPPQERVREIVGGFRAWIESMADSGVEMVPAGRGRGSSPAGAAEEPAAAKADASALLREVRDDLGDCTRCRLCEGRRQIVFGVGNPEADIVFVGEGPGEEEDRQGEPFVGRAGKLLTNIITGGMGIRREDVYIANVVKCRPPGNRNPEPDEIGACEPFLMAQIDAIRPRVIVALGKFAAQTLLRTKTPISRLRGRWHEYRETPLMPTFHPSYLLRNPADKRLVWEDIQQVMREVGLPIPTSRRR